MEKRPRESSSSSTSRSSPVQDAGHIDIEPGTIVHDNYLIRHILGDGTFGRVFEVKDLRDDTVKAMKVIRAVERYVEAAKVEAEILRRVNRADV